LKSHRAKPSLFSVKGGELALSGPAIAELLRAVLDKGLPFRFEAKGASMLPFIRNDDLITVSPLSGNTPRFGDVVAFVLMETGKLRVHRIVGKKGNSFLIKGDNNPDADGLIPKSDVLGRVTKVERDGKQVFSGLGLERILIAFLTHMGRSHNPIFLAYSLIRPVIGRWLV